jgi:hypothetical protein
LIAATPENARRIVERSLNEGIPAAIVAQVIAKTDTNNIVG